MKVIVPEGDFRIKIKNDEVNGITMAKINCKLDHTWFRVRHAYIIQDLRGNVNIESDINKTLYVLNETFKTLSGVYLNEN
jgi:hypothetical protein